MTVPARMSLVTLGVSDIARSTAFYRGMGWPLSPASVEGVVSFFTTAGGLLALYGADALAPMRHRHRAGPQDSAGLPSGSISTAVRTSMPPSRRYVASAVGS